MKKIIKNIFIFAIIAMIITTSTIYFFNNIERFSSTEENALRLALNKRDPLAIERYQYYIDKDVYLFDGPITFEMMADKYNLD